MTHHVGIINWNDYKRPFEKFLSLMCTRLGLEYNQQLCVKSLHAAQKNRTCIYTPRQQQQDNFDFSIIEGEREKHIKNL